jgi:hypothetical protein
MIIILPGLSPTERSVGIFLLLVFLVPLYPLVWQLVRRPALPSARYSRPDLEAMSTRRLTAVVANDCWHSSALRFCAAMAGLAAVLGVFMYAVYVNLPPRLPYLEGMAALATTVASWLIYRRLTAGNSGDAEFYRYGR